MAAQKKKDFRSQIEPFLTPTNIIVGIFSLGLILISLFLIIRNIVGGDSPITKDQIMIEKNGEIVTINKNGLIEYRTEDKVTYTIWSEEKISTFFSSMEEKAREYLKNPTPITDSCYKVTLYLDGKLVTVCISVDDEEINEVFNEFSNDDSIADTSLDDFFDDDDDVEDQDDDDDDISDYFVQPTATPSPVPTQGDGGVEDPLEGTYIPVKADCESWEEQIVGGRAIISNTLCSIQRE